MTKLMVALRNYANKSEHLKCVPVEQLLNKVTSDILQWIWFDCVLWTGWFIPIFVWVALLLKGAFLNPPLILHCEVHTIDSFSGSSPLARIHRPQIILPYVLLSAILPSHFHIQVGVFPVFTVRNVYSFLVGPTVNRQSFCLPSSLHLPR